MVAKEELLLPNLLPWVCKRGWSGSFLKLYTKCSSTFRKGLAKLRVCSCSCSPEPVGDEQVAEKAQV